MSEHKVQCSIVVEAVMFRVIINSTLVLLMIILLYMLVYILPMILNGYFRSRNNDFTEIITAYVNI